MWLKLSPLDYFFLLHIGLERNVGAFDRGQIALGPMERLMQATTQSARVYVITRGMREIRAILTGRLVAFDRYWNLVGLLFCNRRLHSRL